MPKSTSTYFAFELRIVTIRIIYHFNFSIIKRSKADYNERRLFVKKGNLGKRKQQQQARVVVRVSNKSARDA